MQKFLITIGRRGAPRLTQEVFAENAQRAGEQADDLALLGERVDVEPLRVDDMPPPVCGRIEPATTCAQRPARDDDPLALDDQVHRMRCHGAL